MQANQFGLLRPIPAELADRACLATRNLIAALGAFPLDRWQKADWSAWGLAEFREFADFNRADHDFWLPNDPSDPWDFVVMQIADDPMTKGPRLFRALLTMLLAAEAVDLPSVYVGTVCTCLPVLDVLSHLTFVAVVSVEEMSKPGTWGYDFVTAKAAAIKIFLEVNEIPLKVQGEIPAEG